MMKERVVTYGLSCLLAFLLVQASAWAQAPKYLEDLNGRPIKKYRYENITGSPYLHEDWQEGRVILGNGNVYENVPLRYNLIEDLLLFRTREGQELGFVQPVQEFQFNGSTVVYRSGFAPADNHTAASFYEVVTDGEVKLLKKTHKAVREEKAYGTATINKNILAYTNYYIVLDNRLVKVKSGKNLLQALPDHTAELEKYVKEHKLKLKDEAEMARLVAYYNTL